MAVTTRADQLTPEAYAAGFATRLGALIPAAADRSAAFARRLGTAGVDARGIGDVTALDRLPIVTKDELLDLQRGDPPFGGLLADGVRPRRIFQSPGPLYEPDLGDGDHWRWAAALRAAGFTSEDRVLVAFAFHLTPAGAMFEAACAELGATVVPAGVGNRELQVQACADLAISAYIGTPSYLNALLETADELGRPLRLERSFVTAEPLPPSLRTRLEGRVPVVRQGYGTAETGHLGHECEARAGWHVADDALVQVCDLTTGDARYDDGEGQLVVTLLGADYPVVRFGTGDLSAWQHEPCGCGASSPRLHGWLGRVGDAVKVRGMFLHPRQLEQTVGQLGGVDRYRAVIDRAEHRDELHLEVVAATGVVGVEDDVAQAVRDGLRLTATVEVVASLPADGDTLVDRRVWT